MNIGTGAMTGKFRYAVSVIEALRSDLAGNFYPQACYFGGIIGGIKKLFFFPLM
jgi:hypothetical protein